MTPKNPTILCNNYKIQKLKCILNDVQRSDIPQTLQDRLQEEKKIAKF